VASEAAPAGERGRRGAVVVIAVYVVALIALFASGRYAFVPKEALLPAFLLVPAIAGRLRPFARDWAIFLGAVVLFDALRGLVFALVSALGLPVYMGYAIEADRALLGDSMPGVLQRAWMSADLGVFEKALVVVHASHFVVFLLFALGLWLWRPAHFRRFAVAFTLLLYAGLLTYLLFPTVPPWMAADTFEVLPPIRHVTREIYNTALPAFARGFDTNPIAAMPSLHAAIPTLLVLEAARALWRSGTAIGKGVVGFLGVYAAAVMLAIMYLGEHYLIDVVAGVGFALAAYLAAHRWLGPWLARHEGAARRPLRQTLLIAALLFVMTLAVAQLRGAIGSGWIPSPDFVASELDGKSPHAAYYRGFHAFEQGQWKAALDSFAVLPERLRDRHVMRMQARALASSGKPDVALSMLKAWAETSPQDPEPIYWAARMGLEAHTMPPQIAVDIVTRLDGWEGDGTAQRFADELRAIAAGEGLMLPPRP
jgi:hypothetical protein